MSIGLRDMPYIILTLSKEIYISYILLIYFL